MKTIAPWLLLMGLARGVLAAPLATEDEDPVALVADARAITWATRTAVRSLDGGQVVTRAELPEIQALVAVPGGVIAVTEDTLWWLGPTGGARRLHRSRGLIRAAGAEGARLFFTEHPRPRGPGDLRRGTVSSLDVPRGRPRVLARDVDGPIALAVGGGFVYWPSGMELWRAPVRGGKPARFLRATAAPVPADPEKPQPSPRISEIRVDGETVWWQVGQSVQRARLADRNTEVVPDRQTLWMPPVPGAGPMTADGRYYFLGRGLYRAP